MIRQHFLLRLRAGLRGLPTATVEEIVADYDAHFEDALAAGRDEASVAEALGDPARLARELKADFGLRRWEAQPTPMNAAGALFGVLGLAALDIIVLLPIVLSVLGTLFGFFIAALALVAVGAVVMVAGPMWTEQAPPIALVLAGLGMVGLGTSIGALTTLFSIWATNALTWYGRLHINLIGPALEV